MIRFALQGLITYYIPRRLCTPEDPSNAVQWTDAATRGWESWLSSVWHRMSGAGEVAVDTWEVAKDTAKK